MKNTSATFSQTTYIFGADDLKHLYESFLTDGILKRYYSVAKVLTEDMSAGAELFYSFKRKDFFVKSCELAILLEIEDSEILAAIVDIMQDSALPFSINTIEENADGTFEENTQQIDYSHSEPGESFGDIYIPLSMVIVLGEMYLHNESLQAIIEKFIEYSIRLEDEMKIVGLL